MFELSDKRLNNDERELHYYGFNSTQIYIQYRESVDKRLKIAMLDLSKFYIEMQKKDSEDVSQMLMEQYKAFWAAAEPSLLKFYEEIQNILALPENVVPKGFINHQDLFCDLEFAKIEKEIQSLEEQYLSEKYYLHALQQRKEVMDRICIPLKNQIDQAAKLLKGNNKKIEHFYALDEKRLEKMEKFQEGFDENLLLEYSSSWKKRNENLNNFMRMIEENKNNSS